VRVCGGWATPAGPSTVYGVARGGNRGLPFACYCRTCETSTAIQSNLRSGSRRIKPFPTVRPLSLFPLDHQLVVPGGAGPKSFFGIDGKAIIVLLLRCGAIVMIYLRGTRASGETGPGHRIDFSPGNRAGAMRLRGVGGNYDTRGIVYRY